MDAERQRLINEAALCENPAVFRYTWPGRNESVICVECAAQMKAVVDAMSFHLQFLPLDYRHLDLSNLPTCQQKKSALSGGAQR